MHLPINDWHKRYQQQANWTRGLRDYIYEKVNISSAKRILEVGCGTGVILNEIISTYNSSIIGLDINSTTLTFTKKILPDAPVVVGDGFKLPFITNSFDISLCHFVLLWTKQPGRIITEMSRVTNLGGHVLALAEPDYGGRIDYPEKLAKIGTWQFEALINQGADPNMGRQLRSIFHQAGLCEIETGVIGGQWFDNSDEDLNLEWKIIESDLTKDIKNNDELIYLQTLDRDSRKNNHRILFVPTFYAIGSVQEHFILQQEGQFQSDLD
jgi:ubiquinone/menaquinone biosynthesis C-methylase UbiE